MRFRAFGITSAVILAGAAVAGTGVQHAFATGNCPGALPVAVYNGAPSNIGTGATSATGVCLDTGTAPFHGGTIEAASDSHGTYVVIQGDPGNSVAPNGADKGYVGLSNYQTRSSQDTGPRDQAGCTDTGPGGNATNSGGSYGVKQLCFLGGPFASGVTVANSPVPLPVCGNASSNRFSSTPRDGCWIV